MYYIVREYNKNNKWKGTYKLLTNRFIDSPRGLMRSFDRVIVLENLSFKDAFLYVSKGYGSSFVLDYSEDIRNYQDTRKIRVPSRRV